MAHELIIHTMSLRFAALYLGLMYYSYRVTYMYVRESICDFSTVVYLR